MGWQFDGVNDYVTVADNSGLTLPDADWTIAFWMKPDLTGSSLKPVVQWGATAASPYWRILYSQASYALPSGLLFSVKDSGGDEATNNSASLLTDDTWTHISLERSGSTFTLYVDGSPAFSDTDATVDGVDVSAVLYLGSDNGSSNFFAGTMAEFAIWTDVNSSRRTALANKSAYAGLYPTNRTQYITMKDGYTEEDQGATVTNNGSTESATDHPFLYKSVSDAGAVGTESFAKAVTAQKAVSDAGAVGTESVAKSVTVNKAVSDAGAVGTESLAKDVIVNKAVNDGGAVGTESMAMTREKYVSDQGAVGTETAVKNAFVFPTYLKDKFEAIFIEVLDD